ncbi:MAG: F0F1 ATP synthase subunit B [Lachnospiraceae bacterium]|nr:F0F1 ATP synthase subunit B [Lachnospiraceae bacterium]
MQTQQLVTLVPWTVIAQILNLFLQMYLIKRFLFKPINEILEKRKKMADEVLTDARAAKDEAEKLRDEYEQGMSKARAAATQIVRSAQKQAQVQADKVVKEAQDKADAIKAKAEADIAQDRKKALNEVKDEIGGLAMEIAGKVVSKEIREEDHKDLIDEFIQNVGEAS